MSQLTVSYDQNAGAVVLNFLETDKVVNFVALSVTQAEGFVTYLTEFVKQARAQATKDNKLAFLETATFVDPNDKSPADPEILKQLQDIDGKKEGGGDAGQEEKKRALKALVEAHGAEKVFKAAILGDEQKKTAEPATATEPAAGNHALGFGPGGFGGGPGGLIGGLIGGLLGGGGGNQGWGGGGGWGPRPVVVQPVVVPSNPVVIGGMGGYGGGGYYNPGGQVIIQNQQPVWGGAPVVIGGGGGYGGGGGSTTVITGGGGYGGGGNPVIVGAGGVIGGQGGYGGGYGQGVQIGGVIGWNIQQGTQAQGSVNGQPALLIFV